MPNPTDCSVPPAPRRRLAVLGAALAAAVCTPTSPFAAEPAAVAAPTAPAAPPSAVPPAADAAPAAPAAAGPGLSLDDAIAQAVARNPALRGAVAEAATAGARVGEARSALLPRLDAAAGAVYTDHPVQVFGLKLLQDDLGASDMALGELTDPSARADWTARLDLQAAVVDVASWYALSAAAHGRDAGDAAVRAAEARLVLEVVQAYHGAQLAQARRAVAVEAVASARADLERARAHVQSGTGTEADALGMAAALAALEEEALVAAGDAELSFAELDRLLGTAGGPRELTTALDGPAVTPPAGAEIPADHPELARAQAGVDAAQALASRARWSYAPSLGVQGSVEGHRESPGDEGGAAFTAGAFLRMNLFAGLGDAARQDQADAEVSRAEARRDEARAALELGLRRARLSLTQAEGRARVTEEAVRHARESHRLQRARFEAGMAQAADVLRTRAALLEVETRHLAALYARHLAGAQLASALGTLDRHWRSNSK